MPRVRTFMFYGAIALTAFVVASLTMLPASVTARAVEAATNGAVRITATSGKAWNGRGDLRLNTGGKPIVVRDCTWSIQGERLLAGELALKVGFGGPDITGQATLARSMSSMAARDVRLRLSAHLVAEQIERLRGWGASGTVDLNADALTLSADSIAGALELLWRDATAVGFPTLGDYRLTVNGAGAAPAKIELSTLRGPLRLDGRGEASPGKALRFAGSARTDAGAPDKVVLLVAALGPKRADGSFGFDVSVPFPRLASGPILVARPSREGRQQRWLM